MEENMKSHNESLLGKLRKEYQPKLSPILKSILRLETKSKKIKLDKEDEKLKAFFPKSYNQPFLLFKKGTIKKESPPLKVGVVFSGGQAPGGHNVITGLFDSLKLLNKKSKLFGFLGGPSGVIDNKYIEISETLLADYRNQGGFDLIGSGRTKIETEEQLLSAKNTAQNLSLDGLVIIGGDDSNTNAAIMAEYFLQNGCSTSVIGVPKTIDGDLKGKYIPASFGFDTATKVFSELIGNIARDAISAKKYYHFIKLMGRSASHITLECALQTEPNFAFIAEEVEKKGKTLNQITNELTDLICQRAEKGKNYGVVLVPEGLIEFIPEMKKLISELNSLIVKDKKLTDKLNTLSDDKVKIEAILASLSEESKLTFVSLPDKIKLQLLLERDPHGNVQVSLIETEKLLIEKIQEGLKKRKDFKGHFNSQAHFLGYEGRAAFPSNFDSDYCYNLGFVATALLKEKLTGYICSIDSLFSKAGNWKPQGVPITLLMDIELRKGKEKPVIKKTLVDLQGEPFKVYSEKRDGWKVEDEYVYPGPIQFFGNKKMTDKSTLTLELENL
jgi:diphosphate-dependent phosphofructokinase